MTMRGKDRAALRAEAHHLAVIVHIGHVGITPPVAASLEDALSTRELVKCQVAKKGELSARKAADALAGQADAEVIQVIGRTFTLYRFNPDLHREAKPSPEVNKPPVRRSTTRPSRARKAPPTRIGDRDRRGSGRPLRGRG